MPSKREAFRICSLAARRSTAVRKSRPSARRSLPIEWPDDELSVFATLKGSLFAIDDELLLEFRHRFGAFHPFRIPKELGGNTGHDLALTGEPTVHLTPIADALRLLQQLHRAPQLPAGGRHDRPAAGGNARPRRVHPPTGRRTGARERAACRGARAAVRNRWRHLLPRLHRRAAGRRGIAKPRRRRFSRRAATACA